MTYPTEAQLIEMEHNSYAILDESGLYDFEQAARDVLRLVALIRVSQQDRKAAA